MKHNQEMENKKKKKPVVRHTCVLLTCLLTADHLFTSSKPLKLNFIHKVQVYGNNSTAFMSRYAHLLIIDQAYMH